ncbi:MAG: glycosyltransferase family 4 protein [Chloroflexota bacterium]
MNAHIVTPSRGYRHAGVSRFTEQLVRAIQERDRSNSYAVFVNDTARGGFRDSANVRFHPAWLPTHRPAVRIVWEQLLLPARARQLGLEVLHCPVNVAPLASPCPIVLTIHDLTFLLFPERFRRERRTYLAALTSLSARRASRVLTDSFNTKHDVARMLRVPPEKIDVVYPGLEADLRPCEPAAVSSFRERHGLEREFILFLGTIEPRKNIVALLHAYARLLAQGLAGYDLVIAGGRGWMTSDVFASVEALGLGSRVRFAGYVPIEEQALWYNSAALFVYPSLYEGFGLPPLEAMACGTPVVTSNVSSLPEVVGSAALLVDPNRTQDLTAAIAEVLESPEKQEQMSQAGLRQAAMFTWAQAADHTVAAYRQAAREQ